MAYEKKTVKHCKSCGIFKNVDDDPEIESPFLVATLKAGKELLVDSNEVAYSWDDKKYYKCKTGGVEGYILAAIVE